jgi:hypothetical protein
MKKQIILLGILLLFSISIINAEQIQDSIHINILTTDSNNKTITGTYNFNLSISNDSSCNNIISSYLFNSISTEPEGRASFYLDNTNMQFNKQYYLKEYRDVNLIGCFKIAYSKGHAPNNLSEFNNDIGFTNFNNNTDNVNHSNTCDNATYLQGYTPDTLYNYFLSIFNSVFYPRYDNPSGYYNYSTIPFYINSTGDTLNDSFSYVNLNSKTAILNMTALDLRYGLVSNLTNVAWINESNNFTLNQIFNKNITVNSKIILPVGGNRITLTAPTILTTNRTITFPNRQGTVVLGTPSSQWIAYGGSDGNLAFDGSFSYDYTDKIFYVGDTSVGNSASIGNSGDSSLLEYNSLFTQKTRGYVDELYIEYSDGDTMYPLYFMQDYGLIWSIDEYGVASFTDIMTPAGNRIYFGSTVSGLGWQTTGNDSLQLGVAVNNSGVPASGYFSLMEYADLGQAKRSPTTTSNNPIFRIYSSDATNENDTLDLYHDQTNGVIKVGANGALTIMNSSGLGKIRALEFATSTPSDKSYSTLNKYIDNLPSSSDILDENGKLKKGVLKNSQTVWEETDFNNCWNVSMGHIYCYDLKRNNTIEEYCQENKINLKEKNYTNERLVERFETTCAEKDVNVTLIDTQAFENTIMIAELNDKIKEQQSEIDLLKKELCLKDKTYSWCNYD